MATYRRQLNGYLWHSCRNCPQSPTVGYEERETQPSASRLCPECLERILAGVGQAYRAPGPDAGRISRAVYAAERHGTALPRRR